MGCNFYLDLENGTTYQRPLYRTNYYLKNSAKHGINAGNKGGEYEALDEPIFIKQLYKWAESNSHKVPASHNPSQPYIYNTIDPLEDHKGYFGYGVLWWELEGYGRTTFHVYDNVGAPIYNPIELYINGIFKELDGKTYYCNRIGEQTHGYIVMLKYSNAYTAYAYHKNYKEEIKQTKNVTVGAENDIYIGKRPEFIFARANDNNNSNSGYNQSMDIPTGDYYIIASGGGRFRS